MHASRNCVLPDKFQVMLLMTLTFPTDPILYQNMIFLSYSKEGQTRNLI